MKTSARLSQRWPNSLHPRLEHLESRDCPSCTVVQTGDTLTILGDKSANQIVIADSREGGISVTCDAGDPHVFFGVNHIGVETGAGNDIVSVDIRGGAGDDRVTADFGASLNSDLEIHADLGSGNDTLLARVGFDPQPDPPIFRGELEIAALGGAGDDRLTVLVGGGSHGPSVLDGKMTVDLNGGAGDDRAAVDVGGLDILGTLALKIDGDLGDDHTALRVEDDVRVFGSLDVSALAGQGNDIINSFIIPCVLPAGHASLLFDGEAGDDRIAVEVRLDEDDTGDLDVRVLGDVGADDLTLALYDIPDSIHLTALVDGGRGRDVAHVTRNVRVAECEDVFFLDDPR